MLESVNQFALLISGEARRTPANQNEKKQTSQHGIRCEGFRSMGATSACLLLLLLLCTNFKLVSKLGSPDAYLRSSLWHLRDLELVAQHYMAP
jgi:hypothetical protein